MESTKSGGDEPLVGSQQPRIRVTPEAPANDAADVIALAADYNLILDEFQCEVLRAGLGVESPEPGSKWLSDTVVTSCPRQNGKGTIIEALLLASVFLFEEQTVACSAHVSTTTRLSFERMLGYLDNFDDLRKKVASVQRWVGREQVRFRSGQTVVFPARSRGALRGYSIDRLILDEAQYLTSSQFEAVLPTMSARPNTQSWLFGTPPTHIGDGEILNRLRAQALSGRSERLTYLEWSADVAGAADLDDPKLWAQANPALGKRISPEAIMAERAALSDEGFRRERLGVFDVDQREHIFGSAELWPGLAAKARNDIREATAIGVDRSPDGVMAMSACYRDFTSGESHVELVYLRDGVNSHGAAVDWLLDATNRRIPIIIDAMSPAAGLAPYLERKRNLILTGPAEMARACITLADDVLAGLLSHSDSPAGDLALAVDGARRRPVGDAGGWAFDRRDGSVVLSPLVASTLAVYGALAYGRPGPTGEGRSSSGRGGFVM